MNAIPSPDLTELDSARRKIDTALLKLCHLTEELKAIVAQFDDGADRLYEVAKAAGRPPVVLTAARQTRESHKWRVLNNDGTAE